MEVRVRIGSGPEVELWQRLSLDRRLKGPGDLSPTYLGDVDGRVVARDVILSADRLARVRAKTRELRHSSRLRHTGG